ncbi:hypothetical protein Sjap_002356 [Stephania japonica]|uniref:Uncharacterized protein n=1 Tax=Stephania japonica TaxID=461633 RepID=A0AAP0KLY3_9MAGN
MATTRRARWPPPPPTPRILHLPRRPRRKTTKAAAGKPLIPLQELEYSTRRSSSVIVKHRGKLESLFDQERAFARSQSDRRGRVKDSDSRRSVVVAVEQEQEQEQEEELLQWRFQAEILRAECNFLRLEREIAVKKLELNRFRTKRTIKSTIESLHSGGAGAALEEEIRGLEGKLGELGRIHCSSSSLSSSSSGIRDFEVRMCGGGNFDRQACVLQKRLEELGRAVCEEKCVKKVREIAAATLCIDGDDQCKDVEILRRKMESLSKGLLERMEEEYGSMLVSSSSLSSSSASASANSSASSSMRIELHYPSLTSAAIVPQIQHQATAEAMRCDENNNNNNSSSKGCSGRCKSIVRKIVEQVRAETEEWSQMQEMLGRVKEEMEELQNFRDFWKNKALDSDERLQSLKSNVKEWKKRAKASNAKVAELEKQISGLHIELENVKNQKKSESTITQTTTTTTGDCSLKEKEKRVLICSLKENHHHLQSNKVINNANVIGVDTKKLENSKEGGQYVRQRVSSSRSRRVSPLREIGNSSPLLQKKSNSGALFPLHYSEISHHTLSRSVCRGSEGDVE